MNAMNISKHKRGDDRESNYRLLTEPAQLKVRMETKARVPSRAAEIARLEGELARLMEMLKK